MCEVMRSFKGLVGEVLGRMRDNRVVREYLEREGCDVDREVAAGLKWREMYLGDVE